MGASLLAVAKSIYYIRFCAQLLRLIQVSNTKGDPRTLTQAFCKYITKAFCKQPYTSLL